MAGMRSNGMHHGAVVGRIAGGFVAGVVSVTLALGAIAAAEPAGTSPRDTARAGTSGFVTTDVPDSPAGRQTRWLIDASTRLPLTGAQLREHFSARFVARHGSVAHGGTFLGELSVSGGLRLVGVTAAQPAVLTATVTDGCARRLVLALFVDRAGRIDDVTLKPMTASDVTDGRPLTTARLALVRV